MKAIILFYLIFVSVTVAYAAPGDDARLKDAHEQLKHLIEQNLSDPTVLERCKNEAKAMAGSDDPNMCIRRRYQECIFKASAMRAEFCEPHVSKEKFKKAVR